MDGIRSWLAKLGLAEKYADIFVENAIDAEILPELTEQDLSSLGVVLGDRKRILRAVEDEIATRKRHEAKTPGAELSRLHHGDQVSERRQLTVMFCDLVGSTAISERLDAEDLRDVLQRFLAACDDAIRRYGGIVAKHMGDGLLAYFGHPKAHEDDPSRSLHAGLDILEAIQVLSREILKSHGIPLDVRIGAHTGQVVVGEMGSQGSLERDAIVGDTPNIAARLQRLANPGEIVISDATFRLAGTDFEYADLGAKRLKGIAIPVHVHRVVGRIEITATLPAAPLQAAPMIDRESELDLIFDRWQMARQGSGQVVFVCGESGTGKTRLLQAFRERLIAGRPFIISLNCSPHHQNTALHPLLQQITRDVSLLKTDAPEEKLRKLNEWVGKLGLDPETIVPHLALVLQISTVGAAFKTPDSDPKRLRAQLFEALLQIGSAIAARNPVVLLVENMQWCDPSLIEFLSLAVVRYGPERVLIVFALRADPPQALDCQNSVSIVLGNLNRQQSLAMILNTTGGKRLPDQVLEEILSRTDGVPLYIEELTKTLLESGALDFRGDQYVLTKPLGTIGIPASLQDSLMARLDRLERSRELARVAAVIGRSCAREQLVAVAEMSERDLNRGLGELVAAGILYLSEQGQDEVYEFKHSLMQKIAYQSLVKPHRIELHRRVSAVLDQHFPEIAETQPEILALHLEMAGDISKAIALWRRAGALAQKRSANIEAIVHFRNGLRLCQTLAEGEERTEAETTLLVSLGARLLAVNGFSAPEVEATYRRAHQLCEAAHDAPSLLPVLWGLWGFYVVGARLAEAARIAKEFLRRARDCNDSLALIAAHYCQGVTRFYRGDLAGAALDFGAALSGWSPEHQDRNAMLYGVDLGVVSHSYLSWVMALMGRPDEALMASEQAIALAKASENSFNLAFALLFAGQTRQFLGDFVAAEPLAVAGADVSAKNGFQQFLGQATLQLGRSMDRRGNLEGMESLRRGLDGYRATGAALAFPYAHAWLAEALADRHEIDAAFALVEATLARNRQTGAQYYDAALLLLQGDLVLRQDPNATETAETCYRMAIEQARRQQAVTLWINAELRLLRLPRENRIGVPDPAGLTAACAAFSGKVETADLREARAYLKELEP